MSFGLSITYADALAKKVESAGLSMSEFIREYVLNNKTTVVARTPASGDKLKLIHLFNKASNNINQLARSANIANKSGHISDVNYTEILRELQHLSRYMKGCINDVD